MFFALGCEKASRGLGADLHTMALCSASYFALPVVMVTLQPAVLLGHGRTPDCWVYYEGVLCPQPKPVCKIHTKYTLGFQGLPALPRVCWVLRVCVVWVVLGRVQPRNWVKARARLRQSGAWLGP